jgi:exopolyphosphatase/guanosine-5'-triphosphate,3'-diphosphate pyrophosphatase
MFSKKGLRDGISLKKSDFEEEDMTTDQMIEDSIDELLDNYHIDRSHAQHVGALAQQLFDETDKFGLFTEKKSLAKFIKWGAQVYYLGQYVDGDASSQHTFYLLANQSINGLLHKERVKLALIASYKNRTLLRQYSEPFTNWFTEEELDDIRMAGIVTKLAYALDSSKRAIVKNVKLEPVNDEQLSLVLQCSGNSFVEQYETEKHLKHLEKVLYRKVSLKFL